MPVRRESSSASVSPARSRSQELGVELADALHDRLARGRQVHLLLAAIGGILVALEVAMLDEAVDEAAHGREPDVDLLGQGGHADPRPQRDDVEALGLRHRHVQAQELGGVPAGHVPHQRFEVLKDGADASPMRSGEPTGSRERSSSRG